MEPAGTGCGRCVSGSPDCGPPAASGRSRGPCPTPRPCAHEAVPDCGRAPIAPTPFGFHRHEAPPVPPVWVGVHIRPRGRVTNHPATAACDPTVRLCGGGHAIMGTIREGDGAFPGQCVRPAVIGLFGFCLPPSTESAAGSRRGWAIAFGPPLAFQVTRPPGRHHGRNRRGRAVIACDGIPWGRARKVRHPASCHRPRRAMATTWSAPPMTARTAITRLSVKGCHGVRSTRGASHGDKVAPQGEAVSTSMMEGPQLVSRPSHGILASTNPFWMQSPCTAVELPGRPICAIIAFLVSRKTRQ